MFSDVQTGPCEQLLLYKQGLDFRLTEFKETQARILQTQEALARKFHEVSAEHIIALASLRGPLAAREGVSGDNDLDENFEAQDEYEQDLVVTGAGEAREASGDQQQKGTRSNREAQGRANRRAALITQSRAKRLREQTKELTEQSRALERERADRKLLKEELVRLRHILATMPIRDGLDTTGFRAATKEDFYKQVRAVTVTSTGAEGCDKPDVGTGTNSIPARNGNRFFEVEKKIADNARAGSTKGMPQFLRNDDQNNSTTSTNRGDRRQLSPSRVPLPATPFDEDL
ncbi:unnamed protein product [Amoebophrya sp. A25]|nr:unnamed protein product [Amoebophrya sp. A25]|eukprot:GSA25T00019336001.1